MPRQEQNWGGMAMSEILEKRTWKFSAEKVQGVCFFFGGGGSPRSLLLTFTWKKQCFIEWILRKYLCFADVCLYHQILDTCTAKYELVSILHLGFLLQWWEANKDIWSLSNIFRSMFGCVPQDEYQGHWFVVCYSEKR